MAVYIDETKCNGCALCVSLCPAQAVSVIEDKAFIDQKRCTECLTCLDQCPENAVYQVLQKDRSIEERPPAETYSLQRTPPRSDKALQRDTREKGVFWRDGGIWDRIIGLARDFFQEMSSPGQGKRGGSGKHKGRRRGYRGSRGKHL